MSCADSLYMKKDGALSKAKLRNLTITYAQDSDFCILGNTDNAFWMVNDEGQLSFVNTSQIYGFPFELVPVEEETSISSVLPHSQTTSDVIYNLYGIRILSPLRGIYIKNGKKYIVK